MSQWPFCLQIVLSRISALCCICIDDASLVSFNGRACKSNDVQCPLSGTQDLNEKSWDVRKDLVVTTIRKHQPDFLGTQEIVAEYLPFLEKELPEYAHIGRFRRGDGDRFDECSKIFYRQDRWEIVDNDQGSFQLSDTPDVVGSRDWTSMAQVTSWGRFRRIGTDETLYVYNTHWDHRTGRDESSAPLCGAYCRQKGANHSGHLHGRF